MLLQIIFQTKTLRCAEGCGRDWAGRSRRSAIRAQPTSA